MLLSLLRRLRRTAIRRWEDGSSAGLTWAALAAMALVLFRRREPKRDVLLSRRLRAGQALLIRVRDRDAR